MNMENTILKVGDKAKGFKFQNGTDDIAWIEGLTDYIGKIGEIRFVGGNYFTIDFNSNDIGDWAYPISLMHLAVVEEQPKVVEDKPKVEQPKELPLKVGDKAKGFKFETMRYGSYTVYWTDSKEKYIDKVGVVDVIFDDSEFTINFGDAIICYPTSLMHLAVVKEQNELPLKVGDKAKGFRFENGINGVVWNESIAYYIGKIGKVISINMNNFLIGFEDDWWRFPISLMHLAVVEEQPKVIEIDMSKVEKIEVFYSDFDKEINKFEIVYIANSDRRPAKYLRITMKDETKLKIQQEIEELENRINELKNQL